MPNRHLRKRASLVLCLCLLVTASLAWSGGIGEDAAALLQEIPSDRVPTGILYDRVLPLSGIERLDGAGGERPVSQAAWRQAYHEIRRASLTEPGWPPLDELLRRGGAKAADDRIPLAVLDFRYNRLSRDAIESGALVPSGDRLILGEGDPFESLRAFAATDFREHTYSGGRIAFRLDREDYLANSPDAVASIEVDFDDGRGFVPILFDRDEIVGYAETGMKTLSIRIVDANKAILTSSFPLDVRALLAPPPHETLPITATIPYLGSYGSGEAYIYLSDSHTSLTEPVIVIEGFDPDNAMNWPELYDILNMEGLIESLRAGGFDAVVLNFSNGADYIQRNAFVMVELIAQVRARIAPVRSIAVVGASMGGLVGRYALAYMESQSIPHAVRSFISFDSPQTGANVPLGMQYWLQFFSEQSDEAAANLADLDTPAARQMLVYHHTDPPGGTGQADPLRAALLADFASLGGYPASPRLVAIGNGSGSRATQGFNPGAQIIQWEYRSFFVDFTGNVWAVPNGSSQLIFDGLIDFILLPADRSQVVVSGTLPYDNAPGGWRDTMAQLAASDPGYGDIIAFHPNHCFIPSVSALGLATGDLFHDIAGDPNILEISPFDAVYFPAANQEHITITPENAPWFIAEIEYGLSDIAGGDGGGPAIAGIGAEPNPISAPGLIRFTLPGAGAVRVTLHDALGRRVATLADRDFAAGRSAIAWDGRDQKGNRLAPGVYFLMLEGDGFAAANKIVAR